MTTATQATQGTSTKAGGDAFSAYKGKLADGGRSLTAEALTGSLTVACRLPYAVLHCAALHASKDAAKPSIAFIDVRTVGDSVRVAATDGHRLFRIFLPCDHLGVQGPEEPIAVNPAMFTKAPTRKTIWACMFSDGLATAGNPSGADNRQASEVLPGTWRSEHGAHTFPNVDQLMPERFSNAPGAQIGVNPSYLLDCLKLAQRFTANSVVRQNTNTPHTPMVFSFDIEPFWLGGQKLKQGFLTEWSCDWITAECLIMPVMIRDRLDKRTTKR